MTSHTSAGVQVGVAVLLGAPRDVAEAAVAAVTDAGILDVGIALPALVLAARRGCDAAGALAQIAAGRAAPADWSDFELRSAVEEAADEATAARRRFRRGAGHVDAIGPEACRIAAEAVLGGAASVGVGDTPATSRSALERVWVVRLLAGSPVDRTGPSTPDSLAASTGGTVPRARAYLDPFEQ